MKFVLEVSDDGDKENVECHIDIVGGEEIIETFSAVLVSHPELVTLIGKAINLALNTLLKEEEK